jgi:hypothetical protein
MHIFISEPRSIRFLKIFEFHFKNLFPIRFKSPPFKALVQICIFKLILIGSRYEKSPKSLFKFSLVWLQSIFGLKIFECFEFETKSHEYIYSKIILLAAVFNSSIRPKSHGSPTKYFCGNSIIGPARGPFSPHHQPTRGLSPSLVARYHRHLSRCIAMAVP